MKAPQKLLILLLLASGNVICSQVSPLSLKFIAKESSCIVQGEIVNQISKFDAKGKIYTINELSIKQNIGGNSSSLNLNIITRGGVLSNGISTTWTHLPSLKKHEELILFLTKVEDTTYKFFDLDEINNLYTITAGLQGLYRKSKINNKIWHSYSESLHFDDLVETVRAGIGAPLSSNISSDGRKCLNYEITYGLVYENNNIYIKGEVRLNQNIDLNKLKESKIQIRYDTSLLGSSLVSNGIVSASAFGISESEHYYLSVQDYSDDEFFISLNSYDNSPLDSLKSIGQENKDAFKFRLQINNLNSEGFANYNYEEMLSSSRFLNNLTGQLGSLYDCVNVSINTGSLTCPEINDINFGTVAAGVGNFSDNLIPLPGVVTISGNNFGDSPDGMKPPSNMFLGFVNAGPSSLQYCEPPVRDYSLWSDTLIIVRVPTVNRGGEFTNTTHSGTGPIIIFNEENICSNPTSPQLLIPFAGTNILRTFSPSFEDQSGLLRMYNQNGMGGYSVYYTSKLLNNIPGASQSFERALETWQCSTNLNITVQDSSLSNNINSIDYDDSLPLGVQSAIAVTIRDPELCSGQLDGTQFSFNMFFKKYLRDESGNVIQIDFHTNEEPLDPSIDTLPNRDFETVALHELGHCSMLLHTNNPGDVMYKFHEGTKRALTNNDILGGIHTVNISRQVENCLDTFSLFNCVVNNVSELDDNISINYYPNPVLDVLNLQVSNMGFSVDNFEVSLYDITGKLISKQTVGVLDDQLNISIGHFKSGMYIVKIFEGNNQFCSSFKIIKL